MPEPLTVSATGPSSAGYQIWTLFATPVITAEVPNAAGLNTALKEIVLERERTTPTTAHSNLGGWQSSWDFAEWGGPQGRSLIEAVKGLADRLTTDRKGQPTKVPWKVNSWANINRAGHGNVNHIHPGAYWSASYYVDDGGTFADIALGGEFEIHDPRGAAPAMYAPLLGFATPGGLSGGASEFVRPKPGLLILFPSWLAHGVRPYKGNGVRISIAVNLSI